MSTEGDKKKSSSLAGQAQSENPKDAVVILSDDALNTTSSDLKNPSKVPKTRRGRRKLEEVASLNKTVVEFLPNPEYVEYRESNEVEQKEKLGRLEYCFYGCDLGIMPMDLEWYIQNHPVLCIVGSFMLIISIFLAVSSVGYIFRNIEDQMPMTFGWRSIASTYLIPLVYSYGENSQSPPNCSENSLEIGVRADTPYSYYITLGPIISVQASCIIFLTWRSFKAYTLQIAVFFIRLQNLFLAILLILIVWEFIYAASNLKADMEHEMKMSTPSGVSGWWGSTQKHSKCCGIDGPMDWNKLKPTLLEITGQTFPPSCCNTKKSVRKCNDQLKLTDVYTRGCYNHEKEQLQQYGIILIAVIAWTIIVSIVLLYIFEGIESGSRRSWKKLNSTFNSKDVSLETFGTLGIVSMDGRKHYSKLVLRARDYNQFTDGIYDFKYDFEYDIEIQRGEEIMGRAVVEASTMADRRLKLEMEFDEVEGLVTIMY